MLSSRSCPVVLPCNVSYQEFLEEFAHKINDQGCDVICDLSDVRCGML